MHNTGKYNNGELGIKTDVILCSKYSNHKTKGKGGDTLRGTLMGTY